MTFDPNDLPPEVLTFLTERHLATLSIDREGKPPQVTPVGVTFEPSTSVARVITWADSVKAKLIAAAPDTPAAICQVDGGRWLTMYGKARLHDDSAEVAKAVAMYTERYRPPKERPDRVVLVISVDRIVGRVPLPG